MDGAFDTNAAPKQRARTYGRRVKRLEQTHTDQVDAPPPLPKSSTILRPKPVNTTIPSKGTAVRNLASSRSSGLSLSKADSKSHREKPNTEHETHVRKTKEVVQEPTRESTIVSSLSVNASRTKAEVKEVFQGEIGTEGLGHGCPAGPRMSTNVDKFSECNQKMKMSTTTKHVPVPSVVYREPSRTKNRTQFKETVVHKEGLSVDVRQVSDTHEIPKRPPPHGSRVSTVSRSHVSMDDGLSGHSRKGLPRIILPLFCDPNEDDLI